MSTEKNREDFEVAIAGTLEGVTVKEVADCRKGEEYTVNILSSAWWAWQASRAAIEVELPKERVARGYGEQVADALGFNDGVSYCRDAIESIGLKVKP